MNSNIRLYILCGIPFSGKSTLAKSIVNKFTYNKIDLDEVKFELYGKNVKDEDLKQKDWDAIYQEMYKKIKYILEQGKTVIHDTGNFTKYERNLVKQIATKLGLDSCTIYLDIPESLAYQRLLKNRQTKERFDVSDKDFKSTIAEMERPKKEEHHLTFNYDDSIEEWLQKNLGSGNP